MAVIVQEHDAGVEIVQKPDMVPGTIGWKARLLAMGLGAICVFLAVVLVLLFRQRAAGMIPAAEIWIAAIFLAPAIPVLGAFALRESSAALPCRIMISPEEIAVNYGAPLPRPFKVERSGAGILKAEVYHRAHRNYSSSRSHGSYNITLESRISYVRCGRRLIGPMDKPDAKAVAAAMNAVLRPDQAGTIGAERVH